MAERNDKLRATAWAADTLLFCADISACDQAPRNDDDDEEEEEGRIHGRRKHGGRSVSWYGPRGRMTAIAKDLVAAGSDTTAAAVTMTILELMRSRGTLFARTSTLTSAALGASPPSAGAVSVSGYTTAFDEAVREAHNANLERMVDLQSVNEELPFLMACVKEALRLHPPAVSLCVCVCPPLPRPFHLSF